MRLFITGAAITLVSSMVAFILSFQACNSITKPTDTGISDVIEAEDIGGDTINDIKPTDEEGHAIYSLPAIGGSSGSPIVNKKGELIGMIHSVIRYFNQVSISPNYEAMREFINVSIDEHSSKNYFHSIWRTFQR